jgi:hypothetical protein
MSRSELMLKVGLAIIAFSPMAAVAQEAPVANHVAASTVMNGQVQLGEVVANLNVVAASAAGIVSTGLASGNTVTVVSEGAPIRFENRQDLQAGVTVNNKITSTTVDHGVMGVTNTSGNAAQVAACCGEITGDSTQITGAATLRGTTTIDIGSAATVTGSTVVSGNSFGIASTNGNIDYTAFQTHNGSTYATTDIDACCVGEALTGTAQAAGNSYAASGHATTYGAATIQRNNGAVTQASTNIFANAASNVTGATQAAGNTMTTYNEFGYAHQTGYQENSSYVRSETYLTLPEWFGSANASAYGVGNSTLLSNLGSDARLEVDQYNTETGSVDVYASLEGSSSTNGVGSVSATAIGNSITGYVCSSCGEDPATIYGQSNQLNAASVTATGVATVGHAGFITGNAAAVGNSASYIVNRSH